MDDGEIIFGLQERVDLLEKVSDAAKEYIRTDVCHEEIAAEIAYVKLKDALKTLEQEP